MVKDSENYKEQDNAERNRIAARNGLESYLFQMRQKVKDDPAAKSVLTDDEIEATIMKADEVESWLEVNAVRIIFVPLSVFLGNMRKHGKENSAKRRQLFASAFTRQIGRTIPLIPTKVN